LCVNDKGIDKGIATVTLKSMDGVMIRCYIDLSLQKDIGHAVMISLSTA